MATALQKHSEDLATMIRYKSAILLAEWFDRSSSSTYKKYLVYQINSIFGLDISRAL